MNNQIFKAGDKVRIVQADECRYGVNASMRQDVGLVDTIVEAQRMSNKRWLIRLETSDWAWDETNVELLESEESEVVFDIPITELL